MRKTIFKGLTGLLIPFAAYAAVPTGYGAYQRRQPVSAVSHQTLSDAVRPYGTPAASATRVVDGSELAITSGALAKELVIIDAAVPDKHVLYRAAKPGVDIVEIASTGSGLAQLAGVLARYKNLSALHIVSHARNGELLLGDSRITTEDIKQEVGAFSALNGALRAGGDLLLYGCDLAAGEAGMELLEIIQGNTHLDVAASSDKTGARDLEGDWELEISAGDIEAELPFGDKALKDFSAILAAPNGTYNFASGWTGGGGSTLTSTHFLVSARDTNTLDPANVNIYSGSPYPAYIQNGIDSLNNYFYVRADGVDTGSFELTGLTSGEYADGQHTNVHIVGILRDNSQITSSTINGNSGTDGENFNFGAGQLASFSGVQLKAFKLYFDTSNTPANVYVPFFEFRTFTIANAQNPADSDGTLTAGVGVSEPVGLATTVDTVGEAVNVFDFNIADGGTNDSYNLLISELYINVSGTSTDTERGQITWRLNGPDASNVTGTYSAATDRITFSGLNINVANGGNETYTVNAYYNNNTGLTEDRTIILSVDGDTNLTVGALGTQMASTSAVTNGTGTTVDVVATQLVFTTQPAGSVSGSALTTQPVVAARDAANNTDVDFTETVTLTEGSAGTLSNNTQAASNGVATFTNLIYTATADQQSFTLTANDDDGVGSNLPTANANAVTSDVVATKLVFDTQPAPTTIAGNQSTVFSTVPVVSARDAGDIVDTGYSTGITLSEVNGPGSAALFATGDTDGNALTVTVTPGSGVSTFSGMQINYTMSGSSDETFNLRASSGGLTTADSSTLTAAAAPVVTDANISISGAFGTGGAYRIGDTVTATWNNTAGGDNNAGITGVTVDFTQFGGGAAVAATESSGTWTATYDIVAGSIDATNRNVSVTASNASGDTTTADTTNATVDNISPTVTDGNISISGASGTGGAYKIGDTVTATWNNTAGGDNNSDTISNVNVSFALFGGGVVAATNSSGTWTATYTITAGALDATGRNVSVEAIDNAGNFTSEFDTTNATVDNIAPTVTDANISISGATGPGGIYRAGDTVTASWNNTAGGDNNLDTISGVTVNFTQFGGGAAVSATNSSGTWTATYTIVVGAIDAGNRNVSVTATDNAGNATTTADTTNATVDNTGPTVTDGNISISGASGTGGAFKTGDTVTATWNNTAGGDNNSDPIGAVTVNFTEFGGGAAVAAVNSSDTWTATYTIVSGAIDATNRNVSVTATDNVGNSSTTADTTNAMVDNIAPTVTDARISISGASGTGGAFITGDTVTASWNNTAGGDNNSDTISAVTVDFSQFGGGAAVAASNSSDTWTATYTIVSGAIDATNRNVSVTATDNAGNGTTTADTTNATVDNIAPTVTDANISISGASGAGGAFITGDTVTATWNNTAGGDNNSDTISGVTVDFTQFGGGAAVAASNSGGTWTAMYTIVSGAIDATNRNVSVTATDNAGNSTSAADTSNATVDNTGPTVTDANIAISGATGTGGAYKIGDTVTATWNNTAGGDNNSDTISGVTADFTQFGGGAAVSASNSSGTWTATYTIVAGSIDAANRNVSVTATDNAGNSTTTADTTNATVDNMAPTVTDANISISGNGSGTLIVGHSVFINWNSSGSGDNNGDISSVTVDYSQFGGGAAVAATDTGGGFWSAEYTLTPGAINGADLGAALTATDNAGNVTTTADTGTVNVDNAAPVVTDANISISGATGTGGAYKLGDTITATWNNTAGGDNNGDVDLVRIDFAQFGGSLETATDSGGIWTATHIIAAGAIDATNRNISVLVEDVAGNSTTTADTTNATVDNQEPAVTSVGLPANGSYTVGQNLDFTVNYGEAITVDTSGGTPRLALTVGASTRFADYLSGSGTSALAFRYTVQAGDNDSDGIALSAALQPNGGTLRDDAGNTAGTSLGAFGSLASVLVDAQAPAVTSVTLPANGSYMAGQNLDFTVNYDEAITVDTGGGTPRLALTVGASAVFASYLSGSGGTALVFRYTVQAGDNDADGIALNSTLQTNGGTLRDAIGNDAATALGTIGSLASVLVDTGAPAIGSVTLPANDTYLAAENLDFTVNYDEAVTVDTTGGTPRLALTVGAAARFADYLSGSGSTALVFRHIVQAGDVDSDGIALNGTLQTNGGTLRDAAGNNAATALGALGSLAGVLVDAEAPDVTSVILPANATYGAGDNLEFTVNYDEAVTVNTGLGTPRLALTIGTTARFASYISGSGSTALVFRHTVQAGDTDGDGIALDNTLQTNGGALRDASGNDASTALGALGSLAGVLVDAAAPSISSVSLPADGTYAVGQDLDFTVNYDEAVTVAGGTPALALTIGATARSADYVSGSGTTALLFRYTVQAGDNDNDGIALNATLQANGATLRDAAGNAAATALGATGSLAAVLVDTQPPAVDTNTGLNLVEGDSAVVGNARLAASDNVSAAAEITFTLVTVPANGDLSLNAVLLGVNDTFTQDDIDNDRLSYQHDGSQTASDSFGFSVRDAVGNSAAGGVFNFTVSPPEEPVINAPADLDIDATGLFTTVTLRQLLGLAADASDAQVDEARLALASDVADGTDCCNPVAVELNNGMVRLAPGEHTIIWRATDSDNNTAEDTQTVYVHPLVSFGKDQAGVEGGQVVLRFILNGPTPVQLDVPYAIDTAQSSADAADHDLVDGIASFNAGETEVSITVNLAADAPEGDEVLVVNLNEALVNAGAARGQRITITEGNLPPVVTLSLQQNGVVTSLVAPADGPVTVTSTVTDPNGDTPTYDWSMSDAVLIDTDGADSTFTFDPSTLSAGRQRLHVAVGDGAATSIATLDFRVVAQLPVLDASDSDGDGSDDLTEGAGDADGDGIPDYLDNIVASNVLPETAAQTDAYLIECDPGVRCRLGIYSLLGTGGGARLAPADLTAQSVAADEGYEHVGGVFDFEARGLPVAGQSLRVAIPLQAAIPMGAVYRKFQNGQWNAFVEDAANALHSAPGEAGYCPPPGDASWQSGLQAGSFCLQLTLQDGGPNDADGAADGGIEDPGSIAVEEVDEVIEVYPIRIKVKGGGGGSADGFFLAVLALLALLRLRRGGRTLTGGLLLLLAPVQQASALDWHVELGLYQAEGSTSAGELAAGLADNGVSADIHSYDVSRTAYQLSIGYQYHEYFAARFGYLNLGDAEVDLTAQASSVAALADAVSRHYPVSAKGWVLANRFQYPVRDRLSVIVDAGLYDWSAQIELSGGAVSGREVNDIDPLLGIGANYSITESLAAGLVWQRVFFSNQEVDMWGLSGVLRF